MDGQVQGTMMQELADTLKKRKKIAESTSLETEEEGTKDEKPDSGSRTSSHCQAETTILSIKPLTNEVTEEILKLPALDSTAATLDLLEPNDDRALSQTTSNDIPDHGMLHKMFIKCLPKSPKTSLCIFILITFALNASDAGSDMALGYFLYARGFVKEALIVFIADYATSILNILHFMTVSLQNKMLWWVTGLEILMFLICNPVAPAINCACWMVFQVAGNSYMAQHYTFLSKLTCLINGTFESPVQIILLLFFFITSRIQPPWRDTTEFTDSLGNKISFGIYLSVISFCFCWISLIKNVTETYQSSEFLTVLAFVLPNVLFRIFSYTALVVQIREWVAFPISLLFVVNFFIGGYLKPGQSGINLSSSSFCSIFCVVGMPKDPTIKDETGTTQMEPCKLKKLTLMITLVSLPLIIGFCLVTFFVVQHYMKQDINIPFTEAQEFYIMVYSYSGSIGLCGISCLLFWFIFNNPNVSKYLSGSLNALMILLTIVWAVLSIKYLPPGPQSVILLVEKENGGLTVFEGFTFAQVEEENCKVINQMMTCGENSTDILLQFVLNQRSMKNGDQKLNILDGHPMEKSISSTFKGRNVQVFPLQSNKLKAQLKKAKCLECNQQESNACRNMLYDNDKAKICTSICQSIPKAVGIFSNEEIKTRLRMGHTALTDFSNNKMNFRLLDRTFGKKWDWTENPDMISSTPVEVQCKAPKHFFNASGVFVCPNQNAGLNSECKVMMLKCIGNNEWRKGEECRSCLEDQECKDQKKGNTCQNGECFREVMLVNIRETRVDFYDPLTEELGRCSIPTVPKDLQHPLIGVFKSSVIICSERKHCFKLLKKRWSNISLLKEARKQASEVFLKNGSWWVTGGSSTTDGLPLESTEMLEVDKPKSGWTIGPQMHPARKGHCMVSLTNGKVLVAGGEGKNENGLSVNMRSAILYDQTLSNVSNVGEMISEITEPSCALFEERVYFVGIGVKAIITNIFDPQDESWSSGPTLPENAEGGGSLAAMQGKIYYSDRQNIYTLEHMEWRRIEHLDNGSSNSYGYKMPLSVVYLGLYNSDLNVCDFADF